MRDFTYSTGCGCQVTFFAESEYNTSRMIPGKTCEHHTRRDQDQERTRLIDDARLALSEYRHTAETTRTYIMQREFDGETFFSLTIDGESVGGFTGMRAVLVAARLRLGRVTLPVWNCESRNWESELVSELFR